MSMERSSHILHKIGKLLTCLHDVSFDKFSLYYLCIADALVFSLFYFAVYIRCLT